MKVLIVGGSGTLGKCVVEALKDEHEVITAGRNSGDIQVDIEDTPSIASMYKQLGSFDALISTLGKAHFGPLTAITNEQFYLGLNNKLMGQVNLVMEGMKTINDKGSFTLTSGILNHEPVPLSVNAAMANGALDAFVKAAANELPRGLRINIVSPTVLQESTDVYGPFFKGYEPVAGKTVAQAYCKSLENLSTGRVFKVGY